MELSLSHSAEQYLLLARESARANNSLDARMAYFMSIQVWKRAVEGNPSLCGNLTAARKEYIRFIRSDAVYRDLLGQIREVIARTPGIREGDLLADLHGIRETDLKYALYFAVKDGQIRSVRTGNGEWEYHLRSGEEKMTLKSLLHLLCGKMAAN